MQGQPMYQAPQPMYQAPQPMMAGGMMMMPQQMMMPVHEKPKHWPRPPRSQREARWRDEFGKHVITIQQEEGNCSFCFMCPPETRYQIQDEGNVIGTIKEESSCMARFCCPANARGFTSKLELYGKKYKAEKKFRWGTCCCLRGVACCESCLPQMEIRADDGRRIGLVVQDYCANSSNRVALKCYKGDHIDDHNLVFAITERNCNCTTCFLGENCFYLIPSEYYFNCCCSRGMECWLCTAGSQRTFQDRDPHTGCTRGCCCDCCFYNCKKMPNVEKDCSASCCCWYSHRYAVWDRRYKGCCNDAQRVKEPSVHKEFNGWCNHGYEVNKYRVVLPPPVIEGKPVDPAEHFDQQIIFLFACHMFDLMMHHFRGSTYGMNC